MSGLDSYGRKTGSGGYSHVTKGGMPYADDGNGGGNRYRYDKKKSNETMPFGNIIGKLAIFCVFIYGFPEASSEIQWVMVIAVLLYFRRFVFNIVRKFFRWLR